MGAVDHVAGVIVVIKTNRRLPGLFGVASGAIVEHSKMWILKRTEAMEIIVATQALGLESHPFEILFGLTFE